MFPLRSFLYWKCFAEAREGLGEEARKKLGTGGRNGEKEEVVELVGRVGLNSGCNIGNWYISNLIYKQSLLVEVNTNLVPCLEKVMEFKWGCYYQIINHICELTTAINCESPRLTHMFTFPNQMNLLCPDNGLQHIMQ